MLLTPRVGAASGAELGEGPSEEARIRRLAFPRRLHAVACSPMWPAVCFAADGQALAVATDGNFGPLTSRSALVRRLSDYGFRKQRGVDEWRHPAFNAAEPDLAAIVRRGVRQGSAEAASAGDVAVAADATECDALRRSLVVLKRKGDELTRASAAKRARLLRLESEQAVLRTTMSAIRTAVARVEALVAQVAPAARVVFVGGDGRGISAISRGS